MNDKVVNGVGLSVMALTTISQANEVFALIQIILTALSAAVILAYNIWKWVKKAKADGKITREEAKELVDIIADGSKEIAKIIVDDKKEDTNE